MPARQPIYTDDSPLILRFPTGITESENHQQLKKFLKIIFEALPYDVITYEDSNHISIKYKEPMYDSIANNAVRTWITSLMMDPNRNNERTDIPADLKHYSLSVRIGNTVYADILPYGTIGDNREFSFSCRNKIDI